MVAHYFSPVHGIGRYHKQATSRQKDCIATDMETYLAGQDVDDLFVWVLMRFGFMTRRKSMQRKCCPIAGK